MQVIILLANHLTLSLLQSRPISTNSTLLSKLELELPLFLIIWVSCLGIDFVAFTVTKFERIIGRLLLSYYWFLVDSQLL